MSIAAGPFGGMAQAPIRRVASFHNIEKIEEVNKEEEEEEDKEDNPIRPANLQ